MESKKKTFCLHTWDILCKIFTMMSDLLSNHNQVLSGLYAPGGKMIKQKPANKDISKVISRSLSASRLINITKYSIKEASHCTLRENAFCWIELGCLHACTWLRRQTLFYQTRMSFIICLTTGKCSSTSQIFWDELNWFFENHCWDWDWHKLTSLHSTLSAYINYNFTFRSLNKYIAVRIPSLKFEITYWNSVS